MLIAGPTASGKSELALRLAERDGGVIINADASQVYACWRVLSARPDAADLVRAPHRLFGHVAASRRYSTGDWRREALAAIAVARRDRVRPIVVGGTGLYFSALTDGIAEIPPIPPEVRARSEAMLAHGVAAMLGELDAETRARIDTTNPMRVQRAWEVLAATGRGLAWWHAQPPVPGIASAAGVVVMPDTAALDRAIVRRLDVMLAHGVLEEVRRFTALGVAPELPAARAIGAPEFARHLAGETTLEESLRATATATRQFAKRQRTWLRSRMADWTWADPAATDLLALIPPP
ncbi:tRNA (adenosine(37)-N6)-dimethylallyltransferase MiaA [Amaricoccus sp.]|uniref:tRNA (adenosine(37)-N6)-dimethylallyltransferase MiaA n=1 Tax=Amaricoccus sp. TaxID=1872485 RepID=UPI0039E4374D